MAAHELLSDPDPSPFGSDIYRGIVPLETSELMKQAAKQVGLPFNVVAEKGGEYSFKHPLEPWMCQGKLEEGEVLVEINFRDNSEKMKEFWIICNKQT